MQHRWMVGTVALVVLFSSQVFASSVQFKGYTFEAKVVKSGGRVYREFNEDNQIMLKVRPNEEYSIVVYNPLPVRVAAAVTIDGLNSIDGKRTSPRNAKKWMIEPHSSITIAGWQTSKKTLRKFVFTKSSATFAQWREDQDGKRFSRNLGVIGVAWFWNDQELEMALHPPQPFAEDGARVSAASARSKAAAPGAAAPAAREERAGTGMGREQRNVVQQVEFRATAGMFSVRDVLKIFYEFAQEPQEPLPFVDEDEDEGAYAPDMHRH